MVSRGVVGSAVCGRVLRNSLEVAEDAKRPPPRRHTEPSLGEDIGEEAATGSLKISAGMGAADAESVAGCNVVFDGVSARELTR